MAKSLKHAHRDSIIAASVMFGISIIAFILMSVVSVYAGLFIIPTLAAHVIFMWKLRRYSEVHKPYPAFVANVVTLTLACVESAFLIFAAAFPGYAAYVLFIFSILFFVAICALWIWRIVIYGMFLENKKTHHANSSTVTTVVVDSGAKQTAGTGAVHQSASPPPVHYAPPPAYEAPMQPPSQERAGEPQRVVRTEEVREYPPPPNQTVA